MLKETITYKDFNDVEHTKNFYFNLSKAELAEMQLLKKGGMAAYLEEVVASEDPVEILTIFKDLILKSYGIKSSDGETFVKNDEVRTQFTQSNAYSELYMKLITDEDAAVKFFKGIIPPDLVPIEEQKSRQNIMPMQ